MSGLSEKDARKIAFAPHLNIGVFSLMKNQLAGICGKKI